MNKFIWLILSIFLAFTLISCGGGSSNDNSTTTKGTVYDDIVVGLKYQTKGFDGKTDENGQFNYKEGVVKFYLGSLYIGKISTMPKDKKVFLSDILNTKRGDYRSKEVVKLASLLQSLDTTSPNNEKITLNQEKIKELFNKPNQSLEALDLTKLNLSIVPEEEAKKRVKATLKREGITPTDNIKPTAKAGENQTAQEGKNITLDGSKSTDTDGSIVKYEWFKETTSLHVGVSFTKNDFTVGTHTITLKVTDNEGAVASDSVTITITAKPTPQPTPSPTPTPRPSPQPTPSSPTASITPADQATNVSLDSNITIVFSQEMNGSSLTASNIALTKSGTSTSLSYTIATNENNKTLKLKPLSVFDFNTNYTLTIQNVTSKAGKLISPSPTTATFKTLSQPPSGSYLKTGQTTSYQAKDDGDYKKGVDRSYTRQVLNATAGIVIDNVTGLMWQDSNETNATQRNWNDAKTYCDNLTYGGYDDWKLPNINELETIVDYGRARNIPTGSLGAINPIFKYVGQASYSGYWSSTTYLSSTSGAWDVDFNLGHDDWGIKTGAFYVRCAR